ncbi:MAG: hypothetical protein GF317_05210 [Candidatus Lokiarchaeota archaeon]|nr:hypothetical protein [Candidatus Lokiarchaeota archaeon]MBD3199205.1 hypothetical protein [Candidatus Lokiarchaeota archaeon]
MARFISISEEVYELLEKYRFKHEIFSESLKRLLESNLDIMTLAGAWKKIPDIDSALEMIEWNVKKIHKTKIYDKEIL